MVGNLSKSREAKFVMPKRHILQQLPESGMNERDTYIVPSDSDDGAYTEYVYNGEEFVPVAMFTLNDERIALAEAAAERADISADNAREKAAMVDERLPLIEKSVTAAVNAQNSAAYAAVSASTVAAEAEKAGEIAKSIRDDADKGRFNGKDGYTPRKGTDYVDGVSARHEWNGTVLKITSASGTSEADLKGEKGDRGDKGDRGERGEQGIQGIQGIQGERGHSGLVPKVTATQSSGAITINPNEMTEIPELTGATIIVLAPAEDGWDNEWDFAITQGNTAQTVGLFESEHYENIQVQWGELDIGPMFSANSVTICRVYMVDNRFYGEWVVIPYA